MDKQIDAIVYDPSEYLTINKLIKLINMVIEDEKNLTPKMKESMLLLKKYIPNEHIIKTFEEYDKKYVEQIQSYNRKLKLLSNILMMLSEKKGGAAKKRKSVKKKRKSAQKKAKKSVQKKRKSVQKKAKK